MEIPKPDGGVRKLGIPTVLDRFIQQAVRKTQQYIAEGCRWRVDLDLEKVFDRVSHDKLMARIETGVSDQRLLKLVRTFLKAGVMEGGLVSPVDEGTPQGGPLSPLLINIVLDEFDRELERRGLRFARYADDCDVYVRSRRAAERVMTSIKRFITTKLKPKVNEQKSAVARPWDRKFLGFSFTANREPHKRRVALTARGGWRIRRGFTSRRPMLTSTRSGFRD